MAKAQHTAAYKSLPKLLKQMRESAGLTQRELGRKLRKAQSWIYNCETANRRVDPIELILWSRACDVEPGSALAKLEREV